MDQFAELTNTIFDAGMVGKEVNKLNNDLGNLIFKSPKKILLIVACFRFILCYKLISIYLQPIIVETFDISKFEFC